MMSEIDFPTGDPDYTSPEGVKCWFVTPDVTYQVYPDGRRIKRVKMKKTVYETDLQTGNTYIEHI
jgi:hypothetical protein